jgi:UDP-glucose 4-epimerase
MVLGPRDPNLGEGTTAWRNLLRGRLRVFPPGGMHIIDVRDLAAAHVAMLRPGQGPRRYVVSGHPRTTDELVADLRRLTGRGIPVASLPVGVAHAGGRLADLVQRVLPVRLPFSYEAALILTEHNPCDDSRVRAELGLTWRPLDETITDTVRWMVDEGLLRRAQAGDLAPEPAA